MSAYIANLSESEWIMLQIVSAAIVFAGIALVLWIMGATSDDV